ncbi:F-box/LRR-repeat protein 20-like [Asterias rubens]|uniref:F-box/LRR-repeat protein 20-like n=1 Tax=Asterias rubens TaxID=7604 RepID=UPI0014550825|nr:F-box/LRR-repeat protein 20-like [Asterias rubens]
MSFAIKWFRKRRRDRDQEQCGCQREASRHDNTAIRPDPTETPSQDGDNLQTGTVFLEDVDVVNEENTRSSPGRLGLNDLPDELLLRIVSFISPLDRAFINLKLSSKRFLTITSDSSLYHLTTLKVPSESPFSFDVLQRVLRVSGKTMLGVDLSGCEDVTDYTLFRVVARCSLLGWLNISGCKQVTNAGLGVIGNNLKCLRRIDISSCPFITCSGVVQLFKMLGKTLTFININDCLGFREDPHKLVSLAFFCTSLRHLSVGWSRDLVKLNPLLDMDLDRLTQGCMHLEYLDISYSHSTNGSMQSIARNCPVLTTLVARQCFLQDIGLEHIGRGLPRLEWLDLTDCWYITDIGLESLANGCPLLRGIILTRCHEVRGTGVVKVAATCLKLETFVLKQCFKIDSHAIECIGFCAKKLRYLDVSYNQNVTEDTMKKLIDSNRKLRVVTEGCPRVPRGGALSRFPFTKKDPACFVIWETAV